MQDTNENVAAIDIGANFVRMTVAVIKADGSVNIIDSLQKNTAIGRDTFNFKRIKPESLRQICDILRGFSYVMKDYGVKSYLAVCTSGIRDAENKEYVIDQIRMKTGLDVRIINNSEERFFMLKAVRSKMMYKKEIFDDGLAVLNIGSGGIEFYVFEKGKLKFTEYLDMGALRIKEAFSGVEKYTLNFDNVLEEYINSRISNLRSYMKGIKLCNLIVLGGELKFIKGICSQKAENFISKSWFNEFYNSVKGMTVEALSDKYDISIRQAGMLLPNAVLLYIFMELTKVKGILVPNICLRDGMLIDIVESKYKKGKWKAFRSDVINYVWNIGSKYNIDIPHARRIKKFSVKIFEILQKIHLLSEREKLLLEAAAILHDSGKYVNVDKHQIYSFNVVNNEQIIGFSNREIDIIANVVQYHEEEIPNSNHWSYMNLSYEDKIIVSKLSAVLKLAEAMDASGKGKIKDFDAVIEGEELYFSVYSDFDCTLEKWSFKKNVPFFEEVIGLRPIIDNI